MVIYFVQVCYCFQFGIQMGRNRIITAVLIMGLFEKGLSSRLILQSEPKRFEIVYQMSNNSIIDLNFDKVEDLSPPTS